MIPKKIQALFHFIDFLDRNKKEYIEVYTPLCNELKNLDNQRSELKPSKNYTDKQQYDNIQNQIKEKLLPITSNIYKPILTKLSELGIWSGDETHSSIWNNNISAISDFNRDFTSEDIEPVMQYKQMYLSFRTETNTDFLSLSFVFQNLDEVLKVLFDFFKDTKENEFDSFETKTININSLDEAVNSLVENKGKNVKFSIPSKTFFESPHETQIRTNSTNIKNEIIMGHKIEVGDITNNSGQIIVGKDIRISDSLNGKTESADKIEQLIKLIRQEPKISDAERQSLITNFEKVKEEILEEKHDKPKIFKWLSNTKIILENLMTIRN